jgi:hypothetical protein
MSPSNLDKENETGVMDTCPKRTEVSAAKQDGTDPALPGDRSARREMPTLLRQILGARCVMKTFVVFSVVLVTAAAMLGGYPATVGADQDVPFKGHTEYTFEYAYVLDHELHLVYSGTGNATHLGKFTAEIDVNTAGSHPSYTFEGTFTAANGDQVSLSGSGNFISDRTVAPVYDVGQADITGGSGRFKDATGSVVFSDVFSDTQLSHFDQTFDGDIDF